MLCDEEEKTGDEVERIIQEMRMKIVGRYVWRQCRIKGKMALLPDTTPSLGHDVYGVSEFDCRAPDPDLIVLAFPVKYVGNVQLERAFATRVRFSELRPETMPIPGIIDEEHKEVRP